LVDYARWADENNVALEPFSMSTISLAALEKVIAKQKTTFLPGDILLIRSGFTASFIKLSLEEQKVLAERPVAEFAGVESSESFLRFLWKNQFAAVASDSPSFERSPVSGPHADERFILHEWLLAGWGMPIGELFDLEELSETCEKLGRWSFFFSSMPLKIPGGVASPPNAVAIL
jgi:kynurenine formamidase